MMATSMLTPCAAPRALRFLLAQQMTHVIYAPSGTDADRAKMLQALKCMYQLATAPGVGSTIPNAW